MKKRFIILCLVLVGSLFAKDEEKPPSTMSGSDSLRNEIPLIELQKMKPISPGFDRSKRKTNWLRLWLQMLQENRSWRRHIPRLLKRWEELKKGASPNLKMFKDATEEKCWIIDKIGKAADKRGLSVLLKALESEK